MLDVSLVSQPELNKAPRGLTMGAATSSMTQQVVALPPV